MLNKHPRVINQGVEKLLPIAKFLSVIDFSCPVITVAGTNGKGTTSKAMESILIKAGYKTGVYTSPHLFRYTERIRINGEEISDTKCINGFKILKSAIFDAKKLKLIDFDLTFFEFTTLAALINFSLSDLDVVILEVGLGGRLDAVNVVNNDVSVITTIDIDHEEFLGNSRDKIAKEKAGIFKENTYAVVAEFDPPECIKEIANSLNMNLIQINKDFKFIEKEHSWDYVLDKKFFNSTNQINLRNKVLDLPKPNLPLQNVACAITVLKILTKIKKEKQTSLQEVKISNSQIKNALLNLSLIGRFQVIECNKAKFILDVAHNPHAAKFFASKVQSYIKENKSKYLSVLAIFAINKNKDWEGVVSPFLNIVDEWYLIDVNENNEQNGLSPTTSFNMYNTNELQERLKSKLNFKVNILEKFEDVFACIEKQAKERDPSFLNTYTYILVFGSFHTVALGLTKLNK